MGIPFVHIAIQYTPLGYADPSPAYTFQKLSVHGGFYLVGIGRKIGIPSVRP